jgi:protein-S-isoprenylcysteine O-methyltransferase Ste14
VDPYRSLDLARLAWVVFLVYRFVSALKLKKAKQREARRERLLYDRAKKEERFLAEEFRDSFREHRRQTACFCRASEEDRDPI